MKPVLRLAGSFAGNINLFKDNTSEQIQKRMNKIFFNKTWYVWPLPLKIPYSQWIYCRALSEWKMVVLWKDQQRRGGKGRPTEIICQEESIRSPSKSIPSEPITGNSLGMKSKVICLSTKRSSISPASNFTPRIKKSASNRLL
jgi:hypothetical protein